MVAIISIKCIQIYNIDSSILFPKKETSLLQCCNIATLQKDYPTSRVMYLRGTILRL